MLFQLLILQQRPKSGTAAQTKSTRRIEAETSASIASVSAITTGSIASISSITAIASFPSGSSAITSIVSALRLGKNFGSGNKYQTYRQHTKQTQNNLSHNLSPKFYTAADKTIGFAFEQTLRDVAITCSIP
jgi:hypothetical protein